MDEDANVFVAGHSWDPETSNNFTTIRYQQIDACPFAIGDINADGAIDLLDVSPFVALINNGEFACQADINDDGVVNLLDVAPFVAILTGI